jgi:anti-sigma factor RsiW
MAVDDTDLVALIDNELNEEEKSRLLARLAEYEGLRKRYEALRDTSVLITASLDALIENAPLPRLRAMLPSWGAARVGRWPLSGVALHDLAAGFVGGLLAAGVAGWLAFSGAPSEDRDDWRSAVAQYMELYTNETFALRNADQTIEALKLNASPNGWV